MPTIGWVAKVGPNREMIPSFSVAKYGPQVKVELGPSRTQARESKPDGKTPVTGNDPTDAHVPSTPAVPERVGAASGRQMGQGPRTAAFAIT